MGDRNSDQVWHKPGSRVHLPPLPRPSRATLLRAIPSVGVVSLSLVGLLAVPAGSPPPPPAVAAAPIETPSALTVVETPSPEPSPSEFVTEDPDPPHCRQRAHAVSRLPATGSVVYTDSQQDLVSLFDRATGKRTIVLDGGACGFVHPRFIDAHTIAYETSSAYIAENGFFLLNLTSGKIERPRGSGRHWAWLAATALRPDGSALAELGALDEAKAFLLRVTSTRTGRVVYTRSLGYVCYCDGGWTPQELRWSPDGSLLLVSLPGTAYNEVFLLNPKGQNVRPPVAGAYPRWIGSSRTFFYEDGKGDWVRVDSLGARPTVFIRPNLFLGDPVLSPDQSRIAFWDMDKLNIVVYDFQTRSMRRFGRNRGNPLWLDDDTLVITGVKTCDCEGLDYTGLNWALTLSTGKTQRIAVNPLEADVLR